MQNLLSKIPFINNFLSKSYDWHNPIYILKVINEKELRKIRKRILKDLKKEKVINPKALYYLRKYVDASFNKKTVNIEGRFIEKQNSIDQLYALGKSEVYANVSEYYEDVSNAEFNDAFKNATSEPINVWFNEFSETIEEMTETNDGWLSSSYRYHDDEWQINVHTKTNIRTGKEEITRINYWYIKD